MDYIVKRGEELYHHGIKGMRWGIRRYQNKDGSLTKAGEKRYNQEMEKLQKEEHNLANRRATAAKMAKLENARKRIADQKAELDGKKEESKPDNKKPVKKTISEMTDQEVFAYRQRLQNEKDILTLKSQISSLTPKQTSRGEKIIKNYGPKIAEKLWNDVGKNQINKFFEKQLGMKAPVSELEKLTKEANIWKQKENISKSKNTIWNNDKNQREYEKRAEAEQERIRKKNEETEKARKEQYEKNLSDSISEGIKNSKARIPDETYELGVQAVEDFKVYNPRKNTKKYAVDLENIGQSWIADLNDYQLSGEWNDKKFKHSAIEEMGNTFIKKILS